MLKKWYISTFIIVITLLGIASQKQVVLPNQQIVLQFTDTEISALEVKNTIAIVKKQLQDLGVNNIQVKKSEQGALKITYHSDADVASIKETFSKDAKLKIAQTKRNNKNTNNFPLDRHTIAYNLDVYEIKEGNNTTDWGFKAVDVLEFKSKNNRLLNPNSPLFFSKLDLDTNTIVYKLTSKIRKNNAVSINEISCKIPQVRAGPQC